MYQLIFHYAGRAHILAFTVRKAAKADATAALFPRPPPHSTLLRKEETAICLKLILYMFTSERS